MTERVRLPDGPRVRATAVRPNDLAVIPRGEPVVRVHALGGSHPLAWDQMRSWGPGVGRFDHHTWPRRSHPTCRVMYVAWGDAAVTCALAEVYQSASGASTIDRAHDRMNVTVFSPTADLALLDLDGGWLSRSGGNQALSTGPKGTVRAWSRSIYRHHPEIAGLAYRSSVWGPGRCAVLWDRAAAAVPDRPVATSLLTDPGLYDALAAAADELGVELV